jgi:hypothetical protein
VSGNTVHKLIETFESDYCGPDNLIFKGSLDYDADGDMDILVQTNRAMNLLNKNSLGFRTITWGLKPCTC